MTDSSKSPSQDGIPPGFLKRMTLMPGLLNVFNLFNFDKFHEALSRAIIVPLHRTKVMVFKKGSRLALNFYGDNNLLTDSKLPCVWSCMVERRSPKGGIVFKCFTRRLKDNSVQTWYNTLETFK